MVLGSQTAAAPWASGGRTYGRKPFGKALALVTIGALLVGELTMLGGVCGSSIQPPPQSRKVGQVCGIVGTVTAWVDRLSVYSRRRRVGKLVRSAVSSEQSLRGWTASPSVLLLSVLCACQE